MTDDSDENVSRETRKGYPLQWVEGIRPDDVEETVEPYDSD